ncbi:MULTISPECIES: S9 family peptidase [unclassified Saccharopolyspora]|uniref:alpha/beta hydrolase family protein n=1 Tax=Saccharopolyspora TaxID=1835 RepID=UPI00190AF9BF|nr:prolyl oligopeptidase family serine peptidase [Saccharopolyspora sp. HNM0986]MBK0869058.1 prolyl oligopeptidase family serine peptidase [Saccharopolyspora sp. HNM0986]
MRRQTAPTEQPVRAASTGTGDASADESGLATTGRRRRWGRVAVVAAVVLVVLLVGGTFGAGWYVSSQQLEPNHFKKGPSGLVLGFGTARGEPTVLLSAAEGTGKPGVHALTWNGGATMVGDVVSRSAGRVQRRLLGVPPPVDVQVSVKPKVYPSDPRSLLGFPAAQVSVPTELGPAPAWFVPATGPAASTWVIAVHGQHGDPSTAMTGVPAMHRLGLPVLAISYRNDIGAPASPDGLLHLGQSEWRDVDAAITHARKMGAQRAVLDGASMGAAAVLQTLKHSAQADAVASVVLDAPALDYEATGYHVGEQMGAPAPVIAAASKIMEWRAGLDFDELDTLDNPPAIRPPTLLVHGSADEEHPVAGSRELADSGPRKRWPIQYEEFPGAGHTQSWNIDPERYDRVLTDFLRRTALRG